MKKASIAVNVGDPDREGQLLVDEVIEFYQFQGPTQRLHLKATDPKTIRNAMAKIQDNKAFQYLTLSAKCRQRADFLFGMNFTRAVTKLLSDREMISIGRVQTPTLAMVVRRDLEIENFVSSAFFKIKAIICVKGIKI